MEDVSRSHDAGQEAEPRVRNRIRERQRHHAPVEQTPEGLKTWAAELCTLVAQIRPLAEDATARKGQRVRSRRYLREMLCRRLREIEARARAIC